MSRISKDNLIFQETKSHVSKLFDQFIPLLDASIESLFEQKTSTIIRKFKADVKELFNYCLESSLTSFCFAICEEFSRQNYEINLTPILEFQKCFKKPNQREDEPFQTKIFDYFEHPNVDQSTQKDFGNYGIRCLLNHQELLRQEQNKRFNIQTPVRNPNLNANSNFSGDFKNPLSSKHHYASRQSEMLEDEQKNAYEKMYDKLTKQTQENIELKQEITKLQTKLLSYEKKFEALKKENSILKNDKKTLEEVLQSVKSSLTTVMQPFLSAIQRLEIPIQREDSVRNLRNKASQTNLSNNQIVESLQNCEKIGHQKDKKECQKAVFKEKRNMAMSHFDGKYFEADNNRQHMEIGIIKSGRQDLEELSSILGSQQQNDNSFINSLDEFKEGKDGAESALNLKEERVSSHENRRRRLA